MPQWFFIESGRKLFGEGPFDCVAFLHQLMELVKEIDEPIFLSGKGIYLNQVLEKMLLECLLYPRMPRFDLAIVFSL